MEKVAEQRILQKHSKCTRFRVMSTLLKVATSAGTMFANFGIIARWLIVNQ